MAQAPGNTRDADVLSCPVWILANIIFINTLHFANISFFHPTEWVQGSRESGRNENTKDLESEGGFSTGYNFSGSQLSSPLGSNKESELLPHSFEYFFNDGTFVLSVVTSKFWKQQSPFTSNKAGPIITYTRRMGFISQGGVMPCFI